MVSCINMLAISTISLAFRRIPLNIILSILTGPSWQIDSFDTFWSYNTRNDDIKFTSFIVFILDTDFSLWLLPCRNGNLSRCATDTNHLAVVLDIVQVDTVVADRILVLASTDGKFICTV